jgi:hypothetical protein
MIDNNMTEMTEERITKEIDFESLHIKIPDIIQKYPLEKQQELFTYLTNLNEHDRKAYEIALHHLGSSFNIYRSNGFKEWKQSLLPVTK